MKILIQLFYDNFEQSQLVLSHTTHSGPIKLLRTTLKIFFGLADLNSVHLNYRSYSVFPKFFKNEYKN